MELPVRKIIRLQEFDYSSVHYYFLTICSHDKQCIFGSIGKESPIGTIARRDLETLSDHYQDVRIDKFVIMPNHIHMILTFENEKIDHPAVGQVISCYKAGVSRKAGKICPGRKIWQRSFYDHVIRNEKDYYAIWNYIENNPVKWEEDRFYLPE